MAFSNMIAEMRGAVPGYSAMLARTHLREAWNDIKNMRGWSFQMENGGFSIPGQVNAGTVTVQLGTTLVIADATATAAWLNASTPTSLISQRQFRCGAGTIYDIVAYTPGNGGDPLDPFATLTLNRPYIDLVQGNQQTAKPNTSYLIYQPYIPTPVQDFEAWESVLDVTNVINLNCAAPQKERQRIDRGDSQRQVYSNPGTLLPHDVDSRPGSATLGYPRYELYPQPLAPYAYQTWYTRFGPDLVNPGDTLPFPITEDMVKARARRKAYAWAEANKSASNPRGAGADYRFLSGEAESYFQACLRDVRLTDRDRVDLWYSTMSRMNGYGPAATFNPATGAVMSRNF